MNRNHKVSKVQVVAGGKTKEFLDEKNSIESTHNDVAFMKSITALWLPIKVALEEGAHMPEYGHDEDGGADLRCVDGGTILANDSLVFDTGVHIEIPHGCVGLLYSKSGLNVNYGLTSRGVVDEGFTGTIKARVYNHSDEAYTFAAGDKITQIVILPVVHGVFKQVEKLDEADGKRNNSGYGSTGK